MCDTTSSLSTMHSHTHNVCHKFVITAKPLSAHAIADRVGWHASTHTHQQNTHSVRRKQADRKNAYTQPSINETHVRILRIYRELLASNFSPSQCFVQVFPRVICVNDRCCTHARGARRHVITRTHARQRPKKKLFVGGAMPSHRPVADIIATRFASDGVATGGALMSANPINPGRLL